jgi:hypothetical protein
VIQKQPVLVSVERANSAPAAQSDLLDMHELLDRDASHRPPIAAPNKVRRMQS